MKGTAQEIEAGDRPGSEYRNNDDSSGKRGPLRRPRIDADARYLTAYE